jgi:hypothetical protein
MFARAATNFLQTKVQNVVPKRKFGLWSILWEPRTVTFDNNLKYYYFNVWRLSTVTGIFGGPIVYGVGNYTNNKKSTTIATIDTICYAPIFSMFGALVMFFVGSCWPISYPALGGMMLDDYLTKRETRIKNDQHFGKISDTREL